MSDKMSDEGVIIFGEVLFDCFGDDCRLGGAPFNVAWHLQGFGLAPRFVSRIGNDGLGAKVRERMQAWGMDTRWLQTDKQRPTGRVIVKLQNGQPSYEILDAQAYDTIDVPSGLESEEAVLYHGTLALRHEHNCHVLERLRKRKQVFLDLNLRAPWWRPDEVELLLPGTHWLKLNDEEFELLARPGESPAAFAKRYHLPALIITLGAQGVKLWWNDVLIFSPAPSISDLVDTVGAGDAFSAVVLYGVLHDWEWPLILRRAGDFAARVCRQRGALIEEKRIYEEVLHDWKQADD